MNEKPITTRGRVWFEALAGKPAKHVPSVPSVLVADTMMEKERVRFLAIVADPDNRFPCARQGQVGLQEGWNLAKQVRDVIKADESSEKRAIIAIVDVPSQATIYKLIDGVNVDSPEPKQVDQVRADLLAAIAEARSGQRDLRNRLQSQGAQKNRSATLVVRQRLAAEWHSNETSL
jgi:hypothetical protein